MKRHRGLINKMELDDLTYAQKLRDEERFNWCDFCQRYVKTDNNKCPRCNGEFER